MAYWQSMANICSADTGGFSRKMSIHNLIRSSLNRCALCGDGGRRLCLPCRADISRNRPTIQCPVCATAVTTNGLCGACIKNPPFFDHTVTAQIYKPPLSFLIRQYKYGDGWQLSSLLATFLPPPPPADAVLAVPLHPARERWRGFNQSRELARKVFGSSPANGKHIFRVTNTAPQTNQPNTAARKKNVRNAFQASNELKGLSVLVVDDVMSSGATLNEIAKTLKKAGVKSVTNFIVARAP